MSISGLFDIGKSAIFASQTALNAVSNNIANVNTPGYSRHDAILEVANPVQVNGNFIGRGVGDVEVRRYYDRFIHLQIIGQNQSYGKSYSLERGLSHVEQIFNEARNLGLGDSLKEYFNAWQEVAGNPESEPQRTALLQRAQALLQRSRQMERDINETLIEINDDIGNAVNDINAITARISALNEKIAQLEAGLPVEQASYFRDQRDSQLTALAEYMDYTWYEDKNGRVSILAGGRMLVNEKEAYALSTEIDIDGHRNVYLRQDDITSMFSRGRLGGLIAVRGEIETNSLHDLRKLTASIIKETNTVHRTGYGLDGATDRDFFNSLQIYTRQYSSAGYVDSVAISDMTSLTLDEYDIQFDSAATYEVYNRQSGTLVMSGAFTAGGTISFDGIDVVIDGAPAAGDRFLVSPLVRVISDAAVAITDTDQVAAASSDLTLPGDNRKALEIIDLNQGGIANLGGGTFSEYYQGIVTDIGIMSKAAFDGLIYDDNLRFELEKKRDAVSGVSLDEEAANLVRFQRMYEAAGRVLQVADELMEMIINL